MGGRVRYLPRASLDLDRLRDFIASKSPAAALEAVERIASGIDHLATFPMLGVVVKDGHRELALPFSDGAYVVRYRIDGDNVVITRIWHSKEDRSS